MSTETDVLTLGSGKLSKHRIGQRATHLDRARVKNLPVPPGVIIPEELIRECYSNYGSAKRGAKKNQEQNVRLVREDFLRDRLLTALPVLFQDGMWKHDFSKNEGRIKVAIRPAFSFSDGENEPPPAMFHTELNVDSSSAIIILESIKSVLASAHNYQNVMYAEQINLEQDSNLKGHNLRRDVLIMPMVDSIHSGLAFLQHDFEDDVAIFVEGHALDLTQGKVEGSRVLLPKLRLSESPDNKLILDFQKRLQTLMKKVRRVFGDSRDLEIEWADDGQNIWLLQIRFLSRKVVRKEIFSSLLHKEFFPGPASRLTVDLFAESANKAFAFLRVLHPSLPARRPFVININNYICINVSLLQDVCRILGLPSSSVNSYLIPPVLNLGHQKSMGSNFRIFRILINLSIFFAVFRSRMRLGKSLNDFLAKPLNIDSNPVDTQLVLQDMVKLLENGLRLILLIQFAMIVPARILMKFKLFDIFLQRRTGMFRKLLEKITSIDKISSKGNPDLLNQIMFFLLPCFDLSIIGTRVYSSPLNFHTLGLQNVKQKFNSIKTFCIYSLVFPVRVLLGALMGQREKISIFIQSQMMNLKYVFSQIPDMKDSIWSASLDSLLTNEISNIAPQKKIEPKVDLPLIFEMNLDSKKISLLDTAEKSNKMEIQACYLSDIQDGHFNKIKGVYSAVEGDSVNDSMLAISEPSITEWNNIGPNKAVLMDKVALLGRSSFDARIHGFKIINVKNTGELVEDSILTLASPRGPLKYAPVAVGAKIPSSKKKSVKKLNKKKKTLKKE